MNVYRLSAQRPECLSSVRRSGISINGDVLNYSVLDELEEDDRAMGRGF